MSPRKRVLLGAGLVLLALLVVGGLLLRPAPRSSRPIRIELSGSSALRVKVNLEVDGTASVIEGALPMTLDLTGDHVTYKVRRTAGPENEVIAAEVLVRGAKFMSVSSSRGVQGVVGSDRLVDVFLGRSGSMAAGGVDVEE